MIGPKHRALVWLARQFVGVTETTPNGGAMIERFQRAVDGVAEREPWCVGFVQHCAKEVDALVDDVLGFNADNSHKFDPLRRTNVLPLTEWTIALWGAPAAARSQEPSLGSVVVWRSLATPARGHCGIVVEVEGHANDKTIVTVEGNTGSGDQREGDGVWTKRRVYGEIPGFARMGYVSPWP